MEDHTSQTRNRQYIKKLAGEYPYFTQFADLLYKLGLSKYPLLIFPYLMSLVNIKRNYTCWPSVKTICKNCRIPSRGTVHKALKELEEAGIITINRKGKNNIYTIAEEMYLPMKKANKKDKEISKLEATRPYSGHIEREEEEVLPIVTYSEHIRSYSELQPDPIADTNNNKGIKTTNNIKKKKEQKEKDANPILWDSGVRANKLLRANGMKNQKAPVRGKATLNAEANRYFQTLTEEGKKAYDIRADKLSPYITSPRTRRRRFFEELVEIHTAREGNSCLAVPPEISPVPIEAKITSSPIGGLQ